jgi:hypothetical protein
MKAGILLSAIDPRKRCVRVRQTSADVVHVRQAVHDLRSVQIALLLLFPVPVPRDPFASTLPHDTRAGPQVPNDTDVVCLTSLH